MHALPVDTDQIVVTASRSSEDEARTAASAWLISTERIERLGEPLVPALLRLAPSVAVTTQGPTGLFTEVRIRGAENNHTLLFIDGIRANDPAAGDFARFELLNADLASRIEVVRGPQSALWGSQAIGGVVAIFGEDLPTLTASSEAGSFGFKRASLSGGTGSDSATISAAVGYQQADGIDSFTGGGDRDGYRNLSWRLRGRIVPTEGVEIGIAGFAIAGRSQFDGYDPISFERADTLDENRNRLRAGRVSAKFGIQGEPWRGLVALTYLGSANRNLLDGTQTNRTRGTRGSLEAQVEHDFTSGAIRHRLTLAGEAERETFRARDTIFGGFTDQDRTRTHMALTLEWQATAGRLTGDVALRHDMFNRFRDATTVRASLLAELGGGWSASGAYSEGIAQPTFFDLYGFFPNSFYGNPALRPERSRGFETSVRYRSKRYAAAVTAYRQVLHDEIVDIYFPVSTTANRDATSRRSGLEAEAEWRPSPVFRLSAAYAFLDASQPSGAEDREDEVRRPRHSGSLALDGSLGRWNYGVTLAYSGARRDREEVFPYGLVRLDPYALLGARLAYRVNQRVELHVRGANLLDSDYEESAGYRTEGMGLFAGIRLGGRRSSP